MEEKLTEEYKRILASIGIERKSYFYPHRVARGTKHFTSYFSSYLFLVRLKQLLHDEYEIGRDTVLKAN